MSQFEQNMIFENKRDELQTSMEWKTMKERDNFCLQLENFALDFSVVPYTKCDVFRHTNTEMLVTRCMHTPEQVMSIARNQWFTYTVC